MAGQRRYPGPVEAAVKRDLKALVTAHPMGEALEAMAVNLARTLDGGAGTATAAVNRQLLDTLAEMTRLAVKAEDELDAELSAPVLDPAHGGTGEPGGGDGEGGRADR